MNYYNTGNMEDYALDSEDRIENLGMGKWLSEGEVIEVTTMDTDHVGRAIAWCRKNGYDDTDACEGLKKEYQKRQYPYQEKACDSFGNQ